MKNRSSVAIAILLSVFLSGPAVADVYNHCAGIFEDYDAMHAAKDAAGAPTHCQDSCFHPAWYEIRKQCGVNWPNDPNIGSVTSWLFVNGSNSDCHCAASLASGGVCPNGVGFDSEGRCEGSDCGPGTVRLDGALMCTNSTTEPEENTEQGSNCGEHSENPIYFASGNKLLQTVDYKSAGIEPLVWERTFNSLDGVWRFSYSTHLTFPDQRETHVVGDDGRTVAFHKTDADGWIAFADAKMSLSYDDVADEWTAVGADDTVRLFNGSGQLLSITSRAGLSTTLAYTSGNLATITSFAGRSLHLTHAGGRVSTVSTPEGHVFEYEYNGAGQLQYVTWPDDTPFNPDDDPKIEYHYEDVSFPQLVTGMTDELGVRYATYAYDSSGRAILSELAGGVESTSVVYGSNDVNTVTNPLGKQAIYDFQVQNGRRQLSQVDGVATSMCGASVSSQTFAGDGQVDTRTDENGNVTDYFYNSRGLVESKTEAFGTADAVTTTTTWHASFRVPTQIVKPGQTVDMTYDTSGRLLTRTITDTQTQTVPYSTTNNTRVTTYTYTTQGLIETIDGPRTDISDITTYAYDVNGDLLTVTNPLGHVTEIISRDASGRVTAFDDENDLRTELDYDPRGRLKTRTAKSSQGDVITRFQYDAAGLLFRVNLPSGGFVEYEYDDAHRLEAVTNEYEERIEYALDAAGNPTTINYKGPGGTLVATQDQLFDELSRLREITDGLSNTTSLDVDLKGNVTDETDALSRVTSQAYDGLDRIDTITDANSGVLTMDYDDRGNLTSVTDPRGVVTTYIYDGLDNLIQEVSADAGTTTFHYDAAGNLTQKVDARGTVNNYTFDALNRLLTIAYPAHSAEDVAYQYDVGNNALGRLNQVTDASGSTSFQYDDRGNVTQDQRVIDGTTYTIGYSYNLSDQLIETTYPSGRVVDAGRDTQGRVETLSQTITSVTTDLVTASQYDGRGMLSGLVFGNGLYRASTYDLAGRVGTLTLTDSYSVAPVAYSDTITIPLGAAAIIDVLANDKDLNSDALTIFDISAPGQGSVAINGDQTLTYTPTGNQPYLTTFTYQATDGVGPSNIATVTVVVEDPNFTDSDGDGLSDALETSVGLDPYDATDAVADADGDGVDNYAEYLAATDPLINDAGTAAATNALSPLAFWELNETTGSTAVSTSGVHNGSYVSTHTKGASSVQESGTAVNFNGGYVSVPHHADLNMSGDYTFETLVRWTGTEYAAIFYKIPASSPYYGVFITAHGSGKIRFWEGPNAYLYSDAALNDGLWKHLTFVRRGLTLEIWVNGELDATTTATQDNIVTGSGLYLMGRNYSNMKLKGDMDTFAIHTHALSPAQIKAHFLSLGDKDLDSVPTSFEIAYGHDATDANDATEDYDGDGATQYDEYIAGTHPMLHPQGYNGAILSDSPIGFWPLDDVTSTAVDATGNGHTATYSGTYTQSEPGAITEGSSLTLAGGSVVTDTAHIDFEPQGDYTIEAYLQWSDTGYNSIIGSWDSSAVGPFVWKNLNGCCTSNGRITVRDKNQSGYYLGSYSTGLNDGNWRHYAFIRRGNQLEIWIDGVLDKSGTLPTVIAHDTDGFFRVIRDEGGADQVAYYDYALQAADIRQHIFQGKEPPPIVSAPANQLPDNLDRWLKAGDQIAVRDLRLRTVTTTWMEVDEALELVPAESETAPSLEQVVAIVVHDKARTHVYFRQADGTFKFESLGEARQTGFVATASSGLNETWTYNYDAVSNVDSLNKPAGLEDFGYDTLDRLDDYTLPGQAQVTYGYDAVGNRLTETQSGVTQTHTYGSTHNRLTHQSGSSISYDAAGNPMNNSLGTQTYTYDAANRHATVTESSQVVATYTYNALGQRVRKLTLSDDIDFVYDLMGKLIGEYANGVVIREYTYADGRVIAIDDTATGLVYLNSDHLGTPRIATDINGTIVWRWDSDPFGETTPNEDPDGDMTNVTVPLRFPGQYADIETGQYYNYFRTYDPTIGRYTQSDPIGLGGGLNRYAYVGGNPLSYSDPLGLYPATHGNCSGAGCTMNGVRPLPGAPDLGGEAARAARAAASAAAEVTRSLVRGSVYILPLLIPGDTPTVPPLVRPGSTFDFPGMCTIESEEESRKKSCEALRQSILNTCYGLKGRKMMACFEAANTSYRQCMGWE